MNRPIVFLAPLRIEAAAVASGLGALPPEARRAMVIRTGPGRRAAPTARRRGPATTSGDRAATVIIGVAGALAEDLVAGDLVVADALIAPDGSTHDLDGAATGAVVDALLGAGLRARRAAVATSLRLVRGFSARRALAEASGAHVVDLESAHLLGPHGPEPLVVVRAVVDTARAELLSAATLTGGITALRALRRATPVVVGALASLQDPVTLTLLHAHPT